MKAWMARDVNEPQWAVPIHGETASKAKYNALQWCLLFDWSEFVQVRVTRYKKLDDKPLTHENCKDDFYDEETGEQILAEDWINECKCPVCKH